MKKAIISEWTKHCKDPAEKERFEDILRNSPFILARLRDIIKDRMKTLEPSAFDYDSPSWAYLQAHRNGRTEENRQILKLLEFLE